jgi:hypothetical protein
MTALWRLLLRGWATASLELEFPGDEKESEGEK